MMIILIGLFWARIERGIKNNIADIQQNFDLFFFAFIINLLNCFFIIEIKFVLFLLSFPAGHSH